MKRSNSGDRSLLEEEYEDLEEWGATESAVEDRFTFDPALKPRGGEGVDEAQQLGRPKSAGRGTQRSGGVGGEKKQAGDSAG